MASWDLDDVFETEDPSHAPKFKSLERNLWEDEDASDDDGVKDSWDDDDDDDTKPVNMESKKSPATKRKLGNKQPNAKTKPAATPSEISIAVADKSQEQSDNNEPIEKFIPKSEKEFAEYAERIARDLLRPYEKSYHYVGLMKAMNKLAVASLTSTNIKEIVSSMSTVANEKLKVEKAADAGKKKQGQKKKRLQVNKAEGQKFRNVDDDDDGDDDYLD
uniref:Uncharacterized protein n=1 Tax=Leersia perrieri TaxID=77586 RepID=A0A0D9WI64_9ORYZ